MRLPALSAAALLLAACTLPPPRPTSPAPAAAAVPSALAAAWSSASAPAGAIASWTDEDGGPRVITTTPDGRLAIRDGDTGALLDDPRAATLRFDDPAAIAVFGDHLFVAERGRHRVQVLSLPAFAPVASMGADALVAPAGLWLDEGGPDQLRLFVADAGAARMARFALQFDDAGRLQARADGSFAIDATAQGGLAGDPADARLLVATAAGAQAYDADGHAARALPPASGLALWACPEGGGYWLLAAPDGGVTLFDRADFAPRGRFRDAAGRPLRALDLHAAGTPRFPAGALYATTGDAQLAFDLRAIATALDLSPDCVQ